MTGNLLVKLDDYLADPSLMSQSAGRDCSGTGSAVSDEAAALAR